MSPFETALHTTILLLAADACKETLKPEDKALLRQDVLTLNRRMSAQIRRMVVTDASVFDDVETRGSEAPDGHRNV